MTEATESPKPEATENAKPEATENAKPEATENTKPEATESPKLEATENTKPEATESPKPEATESPKPEATENAKPEKDNGSRKQAIRRSLLTGGAFLLGFIVFGLIAVRVWDYSNSPAFCANMCHDVHPEETIAYRDSYHAEVQCTECHMGRVSMFQNIFLKASHVRHIPEVLLGQYDRPMESQSLRPANESCELCHWAAAQQGDKVLEIRRFLPDEDNTEKRSYLVLKIGGSQVDPLDTGMGYGIHWHALNTVEYIATDHNRQDIPWVRAIMPGGREVEYNDVTNPLSAEEIAEAETHIMDCVDCHNRVGHPFPPPERAVDLALAQGHISPDLPFIRKEVVALLTADYVDQEEALATIRAWETQYKASYPELAGTHTADIEQAGKVTKELLTSLVFRRAGITWESFPENGGHTESPGCFRCHDGKHLSPGGESIRLHCNICHSIPVTVDPGDSPPFVPAAAAQEPASHLEANFIADHRFQANEACVQCHGDIEFGDDDSSFCADSACHGRAWPSVELDAAFPHPIELEGKHAETWCHACHEGVSKPTYVCANCHEPPTEPHFGQVCEDCHSPLGFEDADLSGFEHPVTLEGTHATLDCAACHKEGVAVSYECANCHEPPSEPHFGTACEDCHTPISFEGATLPPGLHPVTLVGAHLSAACEGCHAEGQEAPEFVCSNCHRRPENHLPGECDTCHNPEGWAESASVVVSEAPEISHDLDGRDDCFLCHDPSGQILPAPSNHTDYVLEQCVLCHKPES